MDVGEAPPIAAVTEAVGFSKPSVDAPAVDREGSAVETAVVSGMYADKPCICVGWFELGARSLGISTPYAAVV